MSSSYRKRQGKVRFTSLVSIAARCGVWQDLRKRLSLNLYPVFSGSFHCQSKNSQERKKREESIYCTAKMYTRGVNVGHLGLSPLSF